MNHQEKKYRVKSFDDIQKKLLVFGARVERRIISIHYYGVHDGNDVEKFVVYPDQCEVHRLKESHGKYVMLEHEIIADKHAGMMWLKDRGYKTANIVKIDYIEYTYLDGTVGLYIIDDFLNSVILYFPPDKHDQIEKEFGLQTAEVIAVPYNKYLEKSGKLRSIKL